MAATVREIMNRELFSAGPEEAAGSVLRHLMSLGISAAPVLDAQRRPMGMVSLQDLVEVPAAVPIRERMNTPPLAIREEDSIEQAGRLLAETGYHHLVVVDRESRAVGMLSTLNLVRGLLGLPARHPESFPHYDRRTGVRWTDDTELMLDRVEAAPEGPGVFALIHGGPGVPERLIWAESADDVRARLIDILTTRPDPALAFWLQQGGLRFRAAPVGELRRRYQVLRAMLDQLRASAQM
jgi:CBS domain-containing protein